MCGGMVERKRGVSVWKVDGEEERSDCAVGWWRGGEE